MIVCTLNIIFYVDAAKIKNLLNKVNQQVQIVFTITVTIIFVVFLFSFVHTNIKSHYKNNFRRTTKNFVSLKPHRNSLELFMQNM